MKNIFLLLSTVLFTQVSLSQDSISVLWVGNSYTSVNDLPATTRDLALSLNKKITYQTVANGGYTFQMHANNVATYTAIHANPWDVVVLQGQSQEPSFPYSQVNTGSIPYAQQLADSIYKNNACGNVMYYMTWGREVGDPQWDSINTFEKMNQRLYDAYLRIADSSNSAMVSAVGSVWKYMRDNHPSIGLYAGDGSHPSLAGTYVAACTFYASLFRQSPVGASYLGGLDAQTATLIQQAAATVILPNLSTFHLHAIKEPTYANFHATVSGSTLNVVNLSAQATTYSWDFGDGNTANVETPSHTYAANGTYNVQLIASSACNDDTLNKAIQINVLGISEAQQNGVYWYATDYGFDLKNVDFNSEIVAFDAQGKRLGIQVKQLENGFQIWTDQQILFVHLTTPKGMEKDMKLMK